MLDIRSLGFASSQFRTILWRQNAGFEATCLGSTKLLLLNMSSWKEQRSIWTIVCGENVNRKYWGYELKMTLRLGPSVRLLGNWIVGSAHHRPISPGRVLGLVQTHQAMGERDIRVVWGPHHMRTSFQPRHASGCGAHP